MDLCMQKRLIWSAVAALIAVAVLFGAGASHALLRPCSSEHASISHNNVEEYRSTKGEPAPADKACCADVCVACVLIIPVRNTVAVRQTPMIARFGELHDHLLGQVPSPGLEPPRPAA